MPDTLPEDPTDDRREAEYLDQVIERARDLIVPTTTQPVRTAVLLLVAGMSAACAPFPINLIGVAAVVLLVFDKRR